MARAGRSRERGKQRLRKIGPITFLDQTAICGAVARAAAAKRQEREKQRLRKWGAIRSVSANPFAEPWPERPAAKRQEREKWLHVSVETTGTKPVNPDL